MTSRRSFIGSVLALAAAPAIVRAGSLMPIYVPKQGIVRWEGPWTLQPGQHLRLFIDGRPVRTGDIQIFGNILTLKPSAILR